MAANLPSKQAKNTLNATSGSLGSTTAYMEQQISCQASQKTFQRGTLAYGVANLLSSKPRRLPTLPLAPSSRRWLQICHRSKPRRLSTLPRALPRRQRLTRSGKSPTKQAKKTFNAASGTAAAFHRLKNRLPPSTTATNAMLTPSTTTTEQR